MMRLTIAAAVLSLTFAAGGAWAQGTSTAPKMSPEKQAISKACSDQANAKGLHGKERKKFRSACKKEAADKMKK